MATKVAGILGKKVGMTQLFDSKGDVRPVTVLQAGPCVVTQHKSATRDGYEAAQIGLVEFVKESRLTKPAQGHLAKNNLPPVKFMREVPLEIEGTADGDGSVKVGDRVLVEIFEGETFRRHRRNQQGQRIPGRREAASFWRWSEVARFDVSNYRFDRVVGVPLARVQRDADVGTHGQRPRDPAQPARAGRGQGREFAGGRGQRTWTRGWLHRDYEGEEATTRTAWIRRIGDGGSVEGREESGEEGIRNAGEGARATRETIWRRLTYTI